MLTDLSVPRRASDRAGAARRKIGAMPVRQALWKGWNAPGNGGEDRLPTERSDSRLINLRLFSTVRAIVRCSADYAHSDLGFRTHRHKSNGQISRPSPAPVAAKTAFCHRRGNVRARPWRSARRFPAHNWPPHDALGFSGSIALFKHESPAGAYEVAGLAIKPLGQVKVLFAVLGELEQQLIPPYPARVGVGSAQQAGSSSSSGSPGSN